MHDGDLFYHVICTACVHLRTGDLAWPGIDQVPASDFRVRLVVGDDRAIDAWVLHISDDFLAPIPDIHIAGHTPFESDVAPGCPTGDLLEQDLLGRRIERSALNDLGLGIDTADLGEIARERPPKLQSILGHRHGISGFSHKKSTHYD